MHPPVRSNFTPTKGSTQFHRHCECKRRAATATTRTKLNESGERVFHKRSTSALPAPAIALIRCRLLFTEDVRPSSQPPPPPKRGRTASGTSPFNERLRTHTIREIQRASAQKRTRGGARKSFNSALHVAVVFAERFRFKRFRCCWRGAEEGEEKQ